MTETSGTVVESSGSGGFVLSDGVGIDVFIIGDKVAIEVDRWS